MDLNPITYHADFSTEALARDFSRIVVPGRVGGELVERWINCLERRFRSYLELYPHGLWAPGLVVTREMRAETEILMPVAEIRAALQCLCSRALTIPVPDHLPLLPVELTWLDALARLPEGVRTVNPARLLRQLVENESLRAEFLFALHLPKQHGGGFRRYPRQLDLLRRWLEARHFGDSAKIHCLDAACGSGEGTFELAMLLLGSGLSPNRFTLHGISLDPLEIFSAAHGFFPHDPVRQKTFRSAASPAIAGWDAGWIRFSSGDIRRWGAEQVEACDVIMCNGVLGGPFLHDEVDLRRAVRFLSTRLKPGGIIAVADRFHGGWEKKVPKRLICELLAAEGVVLVETQEGIAGTKKTAA